MFFIAGPCVVESKELLDEVGAELSRISNSLNVEIIFKASYKKANRTSINSFVGIGDELALSYIKETGEKYKLRTITDIHTVEEANLAARYVDILQIPAFLSRQTDLLVAAADTGKTINIKKAQFMAPQDIEKAAKKVKSTGNDKIWLTERGTFFGYNSLVVDFKNFPIMKSFGFPVIYDVTHSLQQPSIGETSGGNPEFIFNLARAATACGIDGLFFETHPNPKLAKSDAATQLPLDQAENLIKQIIAIDKLINTL